MPRPAKRRARPPVTATVETHASSGRDELETRATASRGTVREAAAAATALVANPLAGMPVWVRAVAVVGFPVAAFCAMFYIHMTSLGDIAKSQAAVQEYMRQQTQLEWARFGVEQVMCLRGAKGDAQREDCLRIKEPPK